jgi:hypothetical protein
VHVVQGVQRRADLNGYDDVCAHLAHYIDRTIVGNAAVHEHAAYQTGDIRLR